MVSRCARGIHLMCSVQRERTARRASARARNFAGSCRAVFIPPSTPRPLFALRFARRFLRHGASAEAADSELSLSPPSAPRPLFRLFALRFARLFIPNPIPAFGPSTPHRSEICEAASERQHGSRRAVFMDPRGRPAPPLESWIPRNVRQLPHASGGAPAPEARPPTVMGFQGSPAPWALAP